METHNYKLSVTWMHEREGWAEAPDVRDPIKFAPPPEFGGRGGLWSPESLLVLAASSCFMSTFQFLAERSKLALVGYQADAEGRLESVPGKGFRFAEVMLHPVVTLESEDDIPLARKLLEKAERACIVAQSLNFPVRVEARIEVAVPALNG